MSNDTESQPTGDDSANVTEATVEDSDVAEGGGPSDDRPLLFISHKHIDKELASVVKNWVEQRTAGGVDVYLSSDAASEGPGIGMNLDDELQKALWQAGVVLLLYTRGDHDWSYCMYECGVATDPHSPDTRVFVLQCGDDVPSPFADKVRVRAAPEEILNFAVSFLTHDDFFRGHKSLTGFSAESQSVTDAATDLFTQLQDKLPDVKSGADRWSAWPNFYIELSQEDVAAISAAPSDERVATARDLVLVDGKIVDATPGAAMLFGRNEISDGMAVADLIAEWQSEKPDHTQGWFDCICAQLVVAAEHKKAPDIRWETLLQIGGDGRHIIGAGEVERRPTEGTVRFQFHFLKHSVAQPVKYEMTKLNKISKIDLDKRPPEERPLAELSNSMANDGWTRIPIVSDGGKLRYIVHVSMIDRFVARRAWAGEDVTALTLADLLADDEMKDMFESTFVVVGETATVTDAAAAMASKENCEDVFVTDGGSPDEPVIGWLTNKEIATALDG